MQENLYSGREIIIKLITDLLDSIVYLKENGG